MDSASAWPNEGRPEGEGSEGSAVASLPWRRRRPDPPEVDLPRGARTLVLSYRAVRRAVGTIGLFLPLVLGPGGLLLGIGIQPNMSSYYHTPLRDVFVGSLSALGIFLFCYRGHGRVERWTANLAALFAICIALFPLEAGRDPLEQRSLSGLVHIFSGGAFFVVLAVYSLVHFPREGGGDRDRRRRFVYRTSGVVLLASVAAMGSHLFLAPAALRASLDRLHFLFWCEWLAVWAFAAAWLTKGRAILAEIAVDLLALPAHLLERRRGVET